MLIREDRRRQRRLFFCMRLGRPLTASRGEYAALKRNTIEFQLVRHKAKAKPLGKAILQVFKFLVGKLNSPGPTREAS